MFEVMAKADAVVGSKRFRRRSSSRWNQMFGKKVAEQNKFTGARKDAIASVKMNLK